MMKKTVMALGLAGLMSTPVHAQSNYGGINAAFLDYTEDGVSGEASLKAVYGRLGTEFNEHFGGEIRLGVGISDDTVRLGPARVDVELEHIYGAYLRGGFQVASFHPYAILGYTRGKMAASAAGFSDSETESDASFGIGVDFALQHNLMINAEYMNYLDKSGAEIDGIAIGLTARF